MNAEIDRLKQDLEIIGQAVGCEPEFNRCQVWRSVAKGTAGLAFMVLGILLPPKPGLPLVWGAGVGILCLYVGLHYLLPRMVCPDLSRVASTADNDINFSRTIWGIWAVLLFGLFFWCRRLAVPPMVMDGLIVFMVGVASAVWTWRRPWRRFALPSALACVAAGMAIPFLEFNFKSLLLAFGSALAFGGFAGAMILDRQLKAHFANGKAAH